MKYYVYQHLTADTKEVFYIGKGHSNRAFADAGRNKHWHDIVNKHNFVVEFIAYFYNEKDALDFETSKIAEIGRTINNTGPLVNRTSGGQGVAGYKWTEEQLTRHNRNFTEYNKSCEGKTFEQRFGEEKAKKVKQKISNSNSGRLSEKKGKTMEQICGSKERAEEANLKNSISNSGRTPWNTGINYTTQEREKRNKLTFDMQQKVYEERSAGALTKNLAQKYNVNRQTILNYFNKYKAKD